MDVLTTTLALCFLMLVAYRGYSVILFAPVAALLAVLFQGPELVPPMFAGVFMEKLVGFLKPYFPVFLLGALFGKLIELSGFARAITERVIRYLGKNNAMLAVVVVCALLTYGGVSLFVAAFAVYPFAAELYKAAGIPKRLIPGTIALGSFTFTMDALPGSPQIQNIIPTTFFHTTTWAAPRLGLAGAGFVLACGLAYLAWRRRSAGGGRRRLWGRRGERCSRGTGGQPGWAAASAARLPAAADGRGAEPGADAGDSAGVSQDV